MNAAADTNDTMQSTDALLGEPATLASKQDEKVSLVTRGKTLTPLSEQGVPTEESSRNASVADPTSTAVEISEEAEVNSVDDEKARLYEIEKEPVSRPGKAIATDATAPSVGLHAPPRRHTAAIVATIFIVLAIGIGIGLVVWSSAVVGV